MWSYGDEFGNDVKLKDSEKQVIWKKPGPHCDGLELSTKGQVGLQ